MELRISVNTVRTHVQSVLTKLQVAFPSGSGGIAVCHGLVDPAMDPGCIGLTRGWGLAQPT